MLSPQTINLLIFPANFEHTPSSNMSESLNIDFEVPEHLINHYYVSGTIALLLNLLVIYLLLFQSGKLDNFRFYLLAFQVT